MGTKHDVLTGEEIAVLRVNPEVIAASGFTMHYSTFGNGFRFLRMTPDFLVRNGFPCKNISLLLCKSAVSKGGYT